MLCVRSGGAIDRKPSAAGARVEVGAERLVLAMLVEPGQQMSMLIPTADWSWASWFDAELFTTTDASTPPNWSVLVGERVRMDIGPPAWMVAGFWKAFCDGDAAARRVFAEEVSIIRAAAELG